MSNTIGKAEWVDMFREIGLSEETMMKWHRVFETRHPDAHAAFLKWLAIPDAEITTIRQNSR
ncbi:conserved hypothetical protein [Desulfosarcina cetonica]|nr:conserved hypothetical protein [Desulfosarcina cetonica]